MAGLPLGVSSPRFQTFPFELFMREQATLQAMLSAFRTTLAVQMLERNKSLTPPHLRDFRGADGPLDSRLTGVVHGILTPHAPGQTRR